MAWWRERMAREKTVLSVAAALLLITASYLALEPVVKERQRLSAEIPQLRRDLAWMRGHVDEIKRLGFAGPGQGKDLQTLSPVMIENTLRRLGLEGHVIDMRHDLSRGIVLSFSEVAYGPLMEFLFLVKQESGARVNLAEVNRVRDTSGLVDARLSLAPGQPE